MDCINIWFGVLVMWHGAFVHVVTVHSVASDRMCIGWKFILSEQRLNNSLEMPHWVPSPVYNLHRQVWDCKRNKSCPLLSNFNDIPTLISIHNLKRNHLPEITTKFSICLRSTFARTKYDHEVIIRLPSNNYDCFHTEIVEKGSNSHLNRFQPRKRKIWKSAKCVLFSLI